MLLSVLYFTSGGISMMSSFVSESFNIQSSSASGTCNLQLGIGSWTYPWSIGVHGYPLPVKPLKALDLLEKARMLGVDLVQICDNIPLHEVCKDELDELHCTAMKMGIGIQVGTRGVMPDHLARYLEISKKLNSNLLRTLTDTADNKPDMAHVEIWLKAVLPEFEKAGVYIALENHDRFKVKELSELIRKIGSPYLCICLDTVNSFGALECPDHVMNELIPYTINLHIKDFDIERVGNKMGFLIQGRPAGYGKLDMEVLFRQLKNSGKRPDIILEQWTPFEKSVEETIEKENQWAEAGISFLKENMPRFI
jgi:3-oxoisoapionate decarboxylase